MEDYFEWLCTRQVETVATAVVSYAHAAAPLWHIAEVFSGVNEAVLEVVDDIGKAAGFEYELSAGETPWDYVARNDICSGFVTKMLGLSCTSVRMISLGLPEDSPFLTTAGAWVTVKTFILSSTSLVLPEIRRHEPPDGEAQAWHAILANFFNSAIFKISLLQVCIFGVSLVHSRHLIFSLSHVFLHKWGGGHFAPSPITLYIMGAAWAPDIAHGAVWRLLAPIFLHANPAHIFTNILYQLYIGRYVEQNLRSQKLFLLLYLGAGFFGNVFSAGIEPTSLKVGASTSGLGLLGAMSVVILLNACDYSVPLNQSMWMALGSVFMSAITSPGDRIGHAGGFLAGACVMLILSPHRQADEGTVTIRRSAGATILLGATLPCLYMLHGVQPRVYFKL